MSGHGGGGSGLGKVVLVVVLFIVALFVIWYYTGGPERGRTADPFMKPLPPVDTGETYGPANETY